MEVKTPVGRFAPTPSGRMHLGNVFSALIAWLSVKSRGGAMVLRIEDLDTQRTRPEYTEILLDDLAWLGLSWDHRMPDQRTRGQVYQKYLDILREKDLLYPCYCTRSQLHSINAPHASDGTYIYPGTCRELTPAQQAAQTRSPAWRVRVPQGQWVVEDRLQGVYREDLCRDCGDFLVRRADGAWMYQLAVTVDDGEGGITEVVRGLDLLNSSPRQMYLQSLFGFSHPDYGHVPLLLAPDGRRLSKRDRDMDLGQLRQSYTPQALLGSLAYSCGLIHRNVPVSAGELVGEFSWQKLKKDSFCLEIR